MHSQSDEKVGSTLSKYLNTVWSLEFIVSQFEGDLVTLKELASTIAFRYLDFPPGKDLLINTHFNQLHFLVVLFHLDAPIKTPRGKSCAFIVTEGLLSEKTAGVSESPRANLELLLLGPEKSSGPSTRNEKEVLTIDCPTLRDIVRSLFV